MPRVFTPDDHQERHPNPHVREITGAPPTHVSDPGRRERESSLSEAAINLGGARRTPTMATKRALETAAFLIALAAGLSKSGP